MKPISEQMAEEMQRSPKLSEARLATSLRIRAEKLLLLLLYHPNSELWLHRLPDGALIVRPGKLAELLRWKSHDVYTNLDYLKESGYVTRFDRHVGKGLICVAVTNPVGMMHTSSPGVSS